MARIGSCLSPTEKEELTAFLKENRDIFTWSPSDMLGIDSAIVCHKLHIDPAAKPVIQKRRHFAPQRVAIIEAEINKLLEAGFIEEMAHLAWLANVVLVMKKEKGYNQIAMHKPDKEKIEFMIERGRYCYKVMPFGLKNAGTTYQRLINTMFKKQIEVTMEVYIDDIMAIKKAQKDKSDDECEKAFQDLKQYLTSPLLLSKPETAENLYIYLAVSKVAVSSALIREKLRAQLPVFYTSKAILDAETRYPKIEKLILVLVVAARKLRPYFQGYSIIIMTQYPLQLVLHSPNTSQRVMKWALELGQYDLANQPCMIIQAQALADFIAKFTPSLKDAATQPEKALEAENAHADALASLGSALDHQLKRSILVEYLEKPSIDEEPASEVVHISTTSSWQDHIIDSIVNGTLPADRLESRKLQIKVARYYMWNVVLVRRFFSGPHLNCLSPPDDLKILSSIHEGVCGNHSGGRSLAQKALNAGYY
ncbi:hypothetical protein ACFX2F_030813 [Malus domestica]|nr:uncharacterized protein LOC103419017 [Malus domestica]